MATTPEVDVAILGGGLTGATLKVALAHAAPACSVALISGPPEPQTVAVEDDPRLLALSRKSMALLAQWQLWPDMSRLSTAIRTIHVSDQGHLGKTHLHADGEPFGVVAPLPALQQLMAHGGGSATHHRSVVALQPQDAGTRLTFDDGTTLVARQLVLADGGSTRWDGPLGQTRHSQTYPAVALVARVSVDRTHQGTAYEHFTSHGPLALLPVDQDAFSLVWCLPAHEAEHWRDAPDDAFCQALQTAFGWRAGQFLSARGRGVFPLRLMRSEQICRPGLLWLGNAAHIIHPVAGQGFNLALRDIAVALPFLSAGLGHDAAACVALARARRVDIETTIRFTDGLLALFANGHGSLVAGRNLTLSALNVMPGVKQRIARQGMGF